MSAKGDNIGEVTTPTNATFYVYWNKSTGQVHVGNEYAGQASTESDAMRKADHFATTRQIMK
ncbi:MAG TPA: hypothetical protein DCY88_33805 [Cyanobacteria bacterium UBA11372]|nr:hypothetical protein [Cyanobacteria bacterium UBA11372]